MEAITVLQLLALPAGALAVSAFARRMDWNVPLLLVLAGLIASILPFVPEYELSPEIVLFVFLPPLLYSAALDSSYLRLRDVKRPVMLLSIGLVLFTTAVVGWVTYLLVPELTIPAAIAFGAIVAPPDAVAAVAVGRKLGLPRRGHDRADRREPVQRRHRADRLPGRDRGDRGRRGDIPHRGRAVPVRGGRRPGHRARHRLRRGLRS